VSNGRKSPATRDAVAAALARGETVRESACGAGVSERAVTYWLAGDPVFRARLDELRAGLLERSMSITLGATAAAATRLKRLVKSRNERVALSAARAVLETAVSMRNAVSLEQRLRALEEADAARARGRA
jgi:hypothetical protein